MQYFGFKPQEKYDCGSNVTQQNLSRNQTKSIVKTLKKKL